VTAAAPTAASNVGAAASAGPAPRVQGAAGAAPGVPAGATLPSAADIARAIAAPPETVAGVAGQSANGPRVPSTLVPDSRRRSIIGRIDKEISLKFYVEGWRSKVERNGSLNLPRGVMTRDHGDPLVTVALRSDGSVESVHIERTSGVAELDAAVQRIVAMLAPFSPFPPEIAREYDVIEIRRVWVFGDALHVIEDVR